LPEIRLDESSDKVLSAKHAKLAYIECRFSKQKIRDYSIVTLNG